MTSIPLKIRYWAWICLSACALFIAIKAIPFVTTQTSFFDPIFREKYTRHLAIVLMHGACSITALALGPFQFMTLNNPRLRRWHRRTGYLYLCCVGIGSFTGFYMGTMAFGGISSQIAFTSFAVGWLATGILALMAVKRLNFALHRAWMIRNYALTFGAATLRIYLNLFQWLGFDFVTIYPYMAWLSWIPNILAAEWIVRWNAATPAVRNN